MQFNVFVSRSNHVSDESFRGFYALLDARELFPVTLGVNLYTNEAPITEIERQLSACHGAIIVGHPQLDALSTESSNVRATEWNHLEAGMAVALDLPTLIVCDKRVAGGVFDRGSGNMFVHRVDLSDPRWSTSDEITGALSKFHTEIRRRFIDGERHGSQRRDRSVRISYPPEAQMVTHREFVQGTAPSDTDVWVVVHPTSSNQYYVQDRTKCSSGSWELPVYFGSPTTHGQVFEIRALVGPREAIRAGQVFEWAWPKSDCCSITRFVIR